MAERPGPFVELRRWARGAPLGARATTALVALVLLSLVAWLLVPDRRDGAGDGFGAAVAVVPDGPAVGGSPAGSEDDGATAASGGGPTVTDEAAAARGSTSRRAVARSGDATSTSPDGATARAGVDRAGCVSPPGTAKGVTATEVRIVVALVEIVGPAANSLFDLDSPASQRASFEAAVAGINREGGVACRKLVARYVLVNPTDESQMMGVCRDVASSDAFALVDSGGMGTRPAVLACIGQSKVPYIGSSQLTETTRRQFFPYLFAFYYREQVYRSTVFALQDMGFFDPARGFEKLGFVYRDCERDAIAAFRGWLGDVVPDERIVTYNVGCPAVFASEADLVQAVLTFRREGVTHVTTGNFSGDIARFTANAEQQRFRPRYGLPDEALLSIAGGTRAPNADNIADAVAVTLTRLGEQHTPGMAPSPGTQRCNAYRRAAGLAPVWEVAAVAGQSCGQLWMLQRALGNAPEVTRTALQAGLQRARGIDFSFPQGPSDFTGDRVTTGGQFWRVARFTPDCDCWRVVQREFRRGPGT